MGNPDVASQLVGLFTIRLDPDFDRHADRGLLAKQAVAEIEGRIDLVESLNEDRVLRSLLRLVTATLADQLLPDARPRAESPPGSR